MNAKELHSRDTVRVGVCGAEHASQYHTNSFVVFDHVLLCKNYSQMVVYIPRLVRQYASVLTHWNKRREAKTKAMGRQSLLRVYGKVSGKCVNREAQGACCAIIGWQASTERSPWTSPRLLCRTIPETPNRRLWLSDFVCLPVTECTRSRRWCMDGLVRRFTLDNPTGRSGAFGNTTRVFCREFLWTPYAC